MIRRSLEVRAAGSGSVSFCRLERAVRTPTGTFLHPSGSGSHLVTRANGRDEYVRGVHHFAGMRQSSLALPFPNVQLTSFTLIDDVWVVQARSKGPIAACPRCRVGSTFRHSSYERQFWDLPIQGRPVRIRLNVGRWRCRNAACAQSIHRTTAWDGGPRCAPDAACGRHLEPAGSRRWRPAGRDWPPAWAL